MDQEKAFVFGVSMLLLGIFWLMLKPFLGYVLFAVILAFVLFPLQRRLSSVTGEMISALLLIIFSLIVAVFPVVLAAGAVVEDARDFTRDVNTTEVIDTEKIEEYIFEYTGTRFDVETAVNDTVREFTSTTFGSFSQIINLLTNLSIGMTLMLFLLYYFLKDGEKMASWIKTVVPLPRDVADRLYSEINRTTWAVIKGHVLVAVVQGLVAGVGLFVTGVPNYLFWTFIMIILGFIPIIGTVMVWGPASLYLFLVERPFAAMFLALYGVIIVSLTDNVLRPIVVDRRAELNPAVIIIGVIGGVYAFGAPGIFFGPIMLGVLKSILGVFRENYIDDVDGYNRY